MRLDFAGHRAFAMAAGDELRRPVRRRLKRIGIARLDLAA